jgi:predicted esterase
MHLSLARERGARGVAAARLAVVVSAVGGLAGFLTGSLAGCLGSDATSTALFEVPRGAPLSDFYALPYPNDLRVGDDGRIDLADMVRPNALTELYVDAVAEHQRGFSVNAPIFARFDAPIDPASLPATPEASLLDEASVYLVDVDPASPGRGTRVPLRYRFEAKEGLTIGANWLAALPYPGMTLDGDTTYALVMTRRLRALDGTPVGAAGDFAAIAATAVPGDPALARAQARYAPLLAWLDEPGGDERDDVVSAAVFTTQDATSLMGKIRQVVWDSVALPAPREVVALAPPPPNDGYQSYDGIYDGPNFQVGEPPYSQAGGQIELDDAGLPIVQRMEQLRFSFSVPTSAMPDSGWPVVLFAHGTGGSYHSYLNDGSARRLAAQGMAVISIDQVLHGPRVHNGASPEISFFNFQNPLAARYNTLQGALDDFQLVRLALGFDEAVASGAPEGGTRRVRFDPDRIYYFGHSQGGLTGPPFLAHEPLVKGAVLSGAGGLIYFSLLFKTEPVDITALVQLIVRENPLDEFNPVLALLQGWVDLADPTVYAPLLTRRPLPEVGAKSIFQSEGFTDHFTPIPTIDALATAIGGNQVGPVIQEIPGLALRGRPVMSAPVSANLDGNTAVLLQYQQVADSDGHFVLFDVPAGERQSAEFLGTLARTGTATVVAE